MVSENPTLPKSPGADAQVRALYHVAIKAPDLPLAIAFWTAILGLHAVDRPAFGYPGAWLAIPGGPAIVHLYGGGPVFGSPPQPPQTGGGAIDHVSILCTGWSAIRDRVMAAGLDWREFAVPGTPLWQLFVHDPSGIQLELTFDSTGEAGPPPDMSPGRGYVAGENFFDPARYPAFA